MNYALIRSSQIGMNDIQHAIVPFSWDILSFRETLQRDFSQILHQCFLWNISCIDIISLTSQETARILNNKEYSFLLQKNTSISEALAA